MSQHPNARLTPKGRETLVSRVGSGLGVAEAARHMGVSSQTASKWLARARRGEPMSDRSSRPRRLARATPPDAEARVLEARRSMLLAPPALAAVTGVPARTCARIVARSGLPRLADVDRVTGEARLHVAVDDFSRVAYAELLPDERKGACAAFMGRCLAFFAGLGVAVERVMTDNGPGYRSGDFNALLAAEGVRHLYARPFSPWQNDKVERMNRTLAQEWQYGRAWESEAGRASALPAFIERYDWERPHSACGGLPPMSRIPGVNNLLAHNS